MGIESVLLCVNLDLGEADASLAIKGLEPKAFSRGKTSFVAHPGHRVTAFADIAMVQSESGQASQAALDLFWTAVDAFARAHSARYLPADWRGAIIRDDVAVDGSDLRWLRHLAQAWNWTRAGEETRDEAPYDVEVFVDGERLRLRVADFILRPTSYRLEEPIGLPSPSDRDGWEKSFRGPAKAEGLTWEGGLEGQLCRTVDAKEIRTAGSFRRIVQAFAHSARRVRRAVRKDG